MSAPDDKHFKNPASCDLIEDVILEILLRLPVKILVRFKCVCKQWYAIIESQSFVEQHFGQKSNKERLLVPNYKSNEYRNAYALFVDDTYAGFEEPAHLQMPNVIISELLGPVKGVFCLVGQWCNLALLNPSMRQLKSLPKLTEVFNKLNLSLKENVLGFGLDQLSGDYKVVSICYFYNTEVNFPDCGTMVFVYSLSSDCWRIMEDVGCLKTNSRACTSDCNTFLNGVSYWAMRYNDAKFAGVLAFDMTTDKFRVIQVPDCLKLGVGDLTVHGDSIALLSYNSIENDSCEVWVMEKEGSWNRVAVVDPYHDKFWELCLWKNDLFLTEEDTPFLILYNICTKKWQVTQTQLKQYTDFISVFSYKESLVSIKRKGDNCLLWDASPDILAIAWGYNKREMEFIFHFESLRRGQLGKMQ